MAAHQIDDVADSTDWLSTPLSALSAVEAALRHGYRHIDTAQFYGNEKEVGEAVRQSGISRSDVFLTTKILTPGGSVEEDYQKCIESVNKLDASDDDSGYVDLFLIHSPNCGKE